MKIRVLGPFEVTIQNREITPSAPKLRAVLMLLALNLGTVVRVDQLMMELWDDKLPPSASTTLQTYIYQLRKLLHRYPGYGDTIVLETTQSGYLLRLPHGSLDAEDFEALVEEGTRLIGAGELPKGVAALQAALSMWRGNIPVSAVAGPVLQAEIVRLEELRRTALEHRLDAELKLGRHRQLVGELSRLVLENPTHEGLRAKLMLALHRSGRRLDALDTYHNIRMQLSDEMGLEPSTELQKMHHLILSEDPILDYSGPREGGAPGAVLSGRPNQLPPNVFVVGRGRQIQAITQLLRTAKGVPPVVAVVGAPGSGKTALAVHAAHQIRAEYPDGQLWAELLTPECRPVDPAEVLRNFLRAIGFDDTRIPAGTEERSRMFRSWTATNRALIVLDDVVSPEQLSPLLPTGPGCATIVTGRRKLARPRLTGTVTATPLNRGPSWQLLVSALGRARVERESDAAIKIIDSCGGLAAALYAVSNVLVLRPHWPIERLVGWSASDVADNVRIRAASALDEVTEVVRRTYLLLSPPTRLAFLELAGHPGDFSPAEAATVLGVEENESERLLEELVEFQLLDVTHTGTPEHFHYRCSPLVRRAAKTFRDETGHPIVPAAPARVPSESTA